MKLLAKKGRDVKCEERLRVAEFVLNTPDHKLELTARNLQGMLMKGFRTIVESGAMPRTALYPGRLVDRACALRHSIHRGVNI